MEAVPDTAKEAAKIIIAGGGTGGHIFPAVAIANAIKQLAPATTFLFVGANGKMEMEKIPQAGYEIKGLDIAGFNRSSMLKNLGLPMKLAKSFLQVRRILKDFKPDAVIGVGGYSSYPVLRTAQRQGIPTFIHESNSFAGKSNILLGKRARMIFTASENMGRFFPAEHTVFTGNPVRHAISHSHISQVEGLNYFGLPANKKTVLVIGGSLGARAVNLAISHGLDAFEKNNLQLIWQTGKPFFEEAKNAALGKKNIAVHDFIVQPEYAYAAADIVISRSGAMAVAELCLVEKPVIFVPYPHAAEDHQTVNARALADAKAALLVADKNAGKELIPTLLKLAGDENLQQELKNNIKQRAVNNADEAIAQQILEAISVD